MGNLFSSCNPERFVFCICAKTIAAMFIADFLLVAFALFSLYRLKKNYEISKHRFISLLIVLAEMVLCIIHYSFKMGDDAKNLLAMTQDIVKYMGFYYCVYFFTSQAAEILNNKENEFVYYTKLGLISTSIIQIFHCLIAFTISSLKAEEGNHKLFCTDNVWLMMRFLAISVTFGFIMIGWKIQRSILNPLISQQKRDIIMSKASKKKQVYQSVSISDAEECSSDSEKEELIKSNKTYNKPHSSDNSTDQNIIKIERIKQCTDFKECNHMSDIDWLDGILFLISRFVGLIMWTIPIIYVYWGREYIISLRANKAITSEDEEDDEVDYYLSHNETDNLTALRSNNTSSLFLKSQAPEDSDRDE